VKVTALEEALNTARSAPGQLAHRRVPWLRAAFVASLVLIALVPFSQGAYVQTLASQGAILAMLSLAWDLSSSARLFSFGHAAFFGAGAYSAALSLGYLHVAPPLAIVLGGFGGLALSIIIIPGFRVPGFYFSILTVAVASSLSIVGSNSLPGGENGYYYPSVFGIGLEREYAWILVGLLACIALVVAIRRSALGRALAVLRDDDVAAAAIGVNIFATRVVTWLISGFIAGIAGAYFTTTTLVMTPTEAFALNFSILPVLVVTLGGPGSVGGVLVGAVLYSALSDTLMGANSASSGSLIAYGAALVVLAVALREGVVGLAKDLLSRSGSTSRFGELQRAVRGWRG
jgi:branched-chain amino acid transport system permease protein